MAKDRIESSVVGIDLGTSTTLVAEGRGELSTVIPIGESNRWIPSVVGRRDDDALIVGERAESMDDRRVLRSPKSHITNREGVPDTGDQSDGGDRRGSVVDPLVALEMLLDVAIKSAEQNGVQVRGAEVRLGCPAMWDAKQRSTLSDLATAVGLDARPGDLIEEPVAVGVAWLQQQWRRTGQAHGGRTVVVDAGGGTFDVAVLQVAEANGDAPQKFSVLASGSIALAGDEVDREVADHVREQVPGGGEGHGGALRRVARELKEDLSLRESASRTLRGATGVTVSLHRREFDHLFSTSCTKMINFTKAVTREARLRERNPLSPQEIRQMPWQEISRDVDAVVVAGGSGQIPLLQQRLQEAFPSAGFVALENPQTAVVLGLAADVDYRRINLPRPPFDFVVEWDTRSGTQTQVLYEAFSPLFPRANLLNGESLNYTATAPLNGLGIGGNSEVRVYCRPTGDDSVRIPFRTIDRGREETKNYLSSRPDGRRPLRFVLRPEGQLIIDDRLATIKEWPTIRGAHDFGAGLITVDYTWSDPNEGLMDAWRAR